MGRKSRTELFHEAHKRAFSGGKSGAAFGTFTVEDKTYAVLPEALAFQERVVEIPVKAAVTIPYVNGVSVVARVHDGIEGDAVDYGVAGDGRLRCRIWSRDDLLGERLERALNDLDIAFSDQGKVTDIVSGDPEVGHMEALGEWASRFVSRRVGEVAFDVGSGFSAWEIASAPHYRLDVTGRGVGGSWPTSARLTAVANGGLPSGWTEAALAFGADEGSAALALADRLTEPDDGRSMSDPSHDRIEIVGEHPYFVGHAFRERAAAALYSAAAASRRLSPELRKIACNAEIKPRNKLLSVWPAFAEAWRNEPSERVEAFLSESGWKLDLDPVDVLSERFGLKPVLDDAPSAPSMKA